MELGLINKFMGDKQQTISRFRHQREAAAKRAEQNGNVTRIVVTKEGRNPAYRDKNGNDVQLWGSGTQVRVVLPENLQSTYNVESFFATLQGARVVLANKREIELSRLYGATLEKV